MTVLKAKSYRPKDALTFFNFTNFRCLELHSADDISREE